MEGGGNNELADDLGHAVDESAVGSVESQDDESVDTNVTGNEEEISEDKEEEDPGAESGNTWTRGVPKDPITNQKVVCLSRHLYFT